MEETIEKACANRTIPNAVLHAIDRKGNFRYEAAFGVRSLKDGQPAEPIQKDAVHWIASCTKLMTSIAVMQCIEKGLLSLDDDVSNVLYEFKDIGLLTAFDQEGSPQFKKPNRKITLRHLVTHTSGLAYDIFDPTLMKWRAWQRKGLSQGKTVPEKYSFPLLYEPGTKWSYSVGMDWAGLMVERVNGGMSLEEYMKTNIWGPLGIKDITFHLDKREDLRRRMPDMSVRGSSGSGKAIHKNGKSWDDPLNAAFGGAGAYASPSEYVKILHSLLADDGKLLKSSTLNDMFQPQLSEESKASLMETCKNPDLNNQLGGVPLGIEKDWALGGLLIMEDLEGEWAKEGMMTWGGLPNLTWWIDRRAGVCGLYASQIIPQGDQQSVNLIRRFQKAMYERLGREPARL